MKRIKKNYKIKKCFPIFLWVVCNVCGYECKREWMWKITPGFDEYDFYVCFDCFSTEEKLEQCLSKSGFLIKNPSKSE